MPTARRTPLSLRVPADVLAGVRVVELEERASTTDAVLVLLREALNARRERRGTFLSPPEPAC